MPPRFDSSKPFPKLKAIAAAWGWRGLEMWRQTFEHDGEIVVVTWYSTSHPLFCLQINEHPVGNADAYAASVFAVRYGIHTGWHRFELDDERTVEALAPWLRRHHFKDRNWRREFRRRHPECCLDRPTPRRCKAKTLRGEWPPYFPDDPKPPA